MDILKIAVFAVSVSLFAMVVSQYRSDFSQIIKVCSVLAIVGMVAGSCRELLTSVDTITGEIGIDKGYFVLTLKALVTAIIAKITADICRDSGNSALGTSVEFAGKLAVLLLSMPIISAIVETAGALIKSA